MPSTAQYESELSGIEKFRNSQKNRAKEEVFSPLPSPLKFIKRLYVNIINRYNIELYTYLYLHEYNLYFQHPHEKDKRN